MSLLSSWLASPPPDAAIEIAPTRVSAATMTTRAGTPAIQAYAAEALPANAVAASLISHNIADRAAVAARVQAVLGRLGGRPARVALIVPDVVAKVSVIHFDTIPGKRDDLDQLVRWQMRKAAPFPVDDACVTYTAGMRSAEGGGDFLVALARRDIITEYEQACADAGVHAGLVDLSTFSVVNLALASGRAATGDTLIVHMRPEYTSIAIVRNGTLIFFRNRPEGDDETLTDVVHQTAMYYQDRLSGQGFGRVLLGGSGRTAGSVEDAHRSLADRLGITAESIDPTTVAALPDRIGTTPDVMDILAPLTGMLLRTRLETVNA